MTRDEFNNRFQATLQNTEGFTAEQLATINDNVFIQVQDHDADEHDLKSIVDHCFESEFDAI